MKVKSEGVTKFHTQSAKFKCKLKKRINDMGLKERMVDYCYEVAMPDGELRFFKLPLSFSQPPPVVDIKVEAERTAKRMIDGYFEKMKVS